MTVAQLLRRHPRHLAFGFAHFFTSAVGQTYFVGLFVASVTAHMAWAEGTFAALYSGATLLAAFTLPVVGQQIDRYPVRAVSTTVALLLAGALVTLAATASAVAFAVALYVARLGGQGVLPLIGSTVIGRYFERGRGAALSATSIGKSLAEVAVPPLAVWLLEARGFAAVWYAAAAWLLAVFLPATWLLVRRDDPFQRAADVEALLAAARPAVGATATSATDAPVAPASYTRAEALRDRRLRRVLPAYVFSPLVITGVVFAQSLIAEQRAFPLAWMALGVSAYGVARTTLTLLGGALIDRVGAQRLLRVLHVPFLAGLICLLAAPQSWSVPAFFVLAGTTMGLESVLWPSLWAEWFGPRHLGSIKSAVRVFMVLGTAVAPVLFSWGIARSLPATLLAALVCGAAAYACLYALPAGGPPRRAAPRPIG